MTKIADVLRRNIVYIGGDGGGGGVMEGYLTLFGLATLKKNDAVYRSTSAGSAPVDARVASARARLLVPSVIT